jgi:hypothetical protein
MTAIGAQSGRSNSKYQKLRILLGSDPAAMVGGGTCPVPEVAKARLERANFATLIVWLSPAG